MSVTLRPFRPGDEEYAVQWGKDLEFCLANGWTPHLPEQNIRRHWQNFIASPPADLFSYAIEAAGRTVGHLDLAALNAQSGEFGIAIGESGLWGQGIGQQAGRLMLTHAFDVLKLTFVWAEVHEPNERSHKLMHTLGFSETGRDGSDEYQGKVVPMVQYRVTREEFAASLR